MRVYKTPEIRNVAVVGHDARASTREVLPLAPWPTTATLRISGVLYTRIGARYSGRGYGNMNPASAGRLDGRRDGRVLPRVRGRRLELQTHQTPDQHDRAGQHEGAARAKPVVRPPRAEGPETPAQGRERLGGAENRPLLRRVRIHGHEPRGRRCEQAVGERQRHGPAVDPETAVHERYHGDAHSHPE